MFYKFLKPFLRTVPDISPALNSSSVSGVMKVNDTGVWLYVS